MCRSDDSIEDLKLSGIQGFDILPVTDGPIADPHIVGIYDTRESRDFRVAGEFVRDQMSGLSDANLIGADSSILEFILDLPSRPVCLTVSGKRINGLVSWADLQKLPARAAIFGLITGFEISMADAIRKRFPEDGGWLSQLSCDRRDKLCEQIMESHENDSVVDALLCTQFCDKSTIVCKSLQLGESRRRLEKRCGQIEDLRDRVAHANNYSASREGAHRLARTLNDLLELRDSLVAIQKPLPELVLIPNLSNSAAESRFWPSRTGCRDRSEN